MPVLYGLELPEGAGGSDNSACIQVCKDDLDLALTNARLKYENDVGDCAATAVAEGVARCGAGGVGGGVLCALPGITAPAIPVCIVGGCLVLRPSTGAVQYALCTNKAKNARRIAESNAIIKFNECLRKDCRGEGIGCA